MSRVAPSFSHVLCIRASGYPRVAMMFLRKVIFLSTVQAEVEFYMVDRIGSHDVCYVRSKLPYRLLVSKKLRRNPSLNVFGWGRPYGHPNFAMEKPMHLN